MKIAILCISESWGGLEINLYKLASWLKERHNDVSIICNPLYKLYNESQQAGLSVVAVNVRHKKISLFPFIKLSKHLKKNVYDAVIIGRSDNIYAASVLKIMGVKNTKMIYLQQMQIGINKKDPIHNFLYRFLDNWIAPLKILEQQVCQRTNIKKEKVKVIPLCIRTGALINKETKAGARKIMGLPQDEKIVGMIGRMDPQKGHEIFLKALSILIQKGYDIKGLIAGVKENEMNSPYLQKLKRQISELNLEGRIYFRPFTANIVSTFTSLDIFTMCSMAETFGMVTVEALACGVPVVGADSLGTKEILDSGRYGVMAEPGNPESFAKGIEKLLIDPGSAHSLSEVGKIYAQSEFDYTVQCKLIENLIGEKK